MPPRATTMRGSRLVHLQSTSTSVSFTLTIYVVSCKMPLRATTMRGSRLVHLERHEHLSVLHTHHIHSVLQDAPKSGYHEGATNNTSWKTLTPQCPLHSPYTSCLARCPQEGLPLYIYRSYQNTSTLYIYGVATTSRLLKIIGLFCKKALWKRRY